MIQVPTLGNEGPTTVGSEAGVEGLGLLLAGASAGVRQDEDVLDE